MKRSETKCWFSLILMIMHILFAAQINPQPNPNERGCGNGAVWREADVVAGIEDVFSSGENINIFPKAITRRCVHRKIWLKRWQARRPAYSVRPANVRRVYLAAAGSVSRNEA